MLNPNLLLFHTLINAEEHLQVQIFGHFQGFSMYFYQIQVVFRPRVKDSSTFKELKAP